MIVPRFLLPWLLLGQRAVRCQFDYGAYGGLENEEETGTEASVDTGTTTTVAPAARGQSLGVDCGSADGDVITVHYYGNAMSVYAAASPDACSAVAVEPFVFRLDDAGRDECGIRTDLATRTKYLDLVGQQGPVRVASDPILRAQCSYTSIHEWGEPSMSQVEEPLIMTRSAAVVPVAGIANGTVEIIISDINNSEDSVKGLGAPIKMSIRYYPEADESGFRVWNCQVVDRYPDHQVTMMILINGCGDGYVIKRHRGFFTKPKKREDRRLDLSWYEAKGPVFRLMGMEGLTTFQVGCDVIVCPADRDLCNKKSCRDQYSIHDVDARNAASNGNSNNANNNGNINNGNSNSNGNSNNARGKRSLSNLSRVDPVLKSYYGLLHAVSGVISVSQTFGG